MSVKKTFALFMTVAVLCGCLLTGCNQSPEAQARKAIKTVALTVGDHEINAVELNYYYVEIINSFCNDYSYYLSSMLNIYAPLNEQIFDSKTGQTWADYFLEQTKNNIRGTYLLYDAALEAGLELNDSQRATVESVVEGIEYYAQYYGFSSTNAYLTDLFGYGASLETYITYYETNLLADSYYRHYFNSLEYNDADLRAYEADKMVSFNSYSYAYYYLDASKFLSGSSTTSTDEQKAAALNAAKEAANSLAAGEYADAEVFNTAIKALDINAGVTSASCTENTDIAYSSIASNFQKWISDSARANGDTTVIAKTSAGDNNKEVTDGYYILLYFGCNDNTFLLKNVRHILVMPEGGTYNSNTGSYDHTDAEWAAANTTAQTLLTQWLNGDASEESFAALANSDSDDSDGTDGGLYENVYPDQMVAAFNDWCYDEKRQPGDYEIIKTEFGYHIMYFVGNSDITFRDFIITDELRNNDTAQWYSEALEAMTLQIKNLNFVPMDMILYG